MKGYTTENGYMGYVNGNYQLFASEADYREWMEDQSMLWEEYYEKVWDWATSTSVNKISQLESFGSAEEVHEVICELGFYDEKGAARLMKKALAAGVKFDKDQLMDLYLTCDDKELEHAMGNVIDSMMEEELVEMEEPEYKPSR